jgi:hypothetical protein
MYITLGVAFKSRPIEERSAVLQRSVFRKELDVSEEHIAFNFRVEK